MYAAANRILGRLAKVTPSSKVVGDLALHLVAAGRRPGRLRREPAELRHPRLRHRLPGGELGDLPGGWPEPFRTKALAGPRRCTVARRPSCRAEDRAGSGRGGRRPARQTLNRLLFPGPTKEYLEQPRDVRRRVGRLDTLDYLYGLRPGEEHVVAARTGRQPDPRARGDRRRRTSKGMRTVMCTLNGQLRPVFVRDTSGSGRREGGREGRPDRAGPCRRTVRRGRHGHASRRATTVEAGAARSRPSRP